MTVVRRIRACVCDSTGVFLFKFFFLFSYTLYLYLFAFYLSSSVRTKFFVKSEKYENRFPRRLPAVTDDNFLHVMATNYFRFPVSSFGVTIVMSASVPGSSINVPCSYVLIGKIVFFYHLPSIKTNFYRFP